jgi:GT2 family glycosyltransferase
MFDIVPVIVVVFNRPEYTQVCLDSLYDADPGCIIWPIIINNGSRRRTKSVLGRWIERYEELPQERQGLIKKPLIIENDKNGGFAVGVNLGIKTILEDGSYGPTTILHNDTFVFDGWAAEMRSCLTSSDEEVAVVIPRTSYANEHGMCIEEIRNQFLNIKPSNKLRITVDEINAILYTVYGKDLKKPEKFGPEVLDSSYSSEIASFCMMVRPEIIKKYQFWDEDFFPRGYEDKYWFLPIERNGYVCMISEKAFVHHFGNITSDGPGFCFQEMSQVNKDRFLRKVREMDAKDKNER